LGGSRRITVDENAAVGLVFYVFVKGRPPSLHRLCELETLDDDEPSAGNSLDCEMNGQRPHREPVLIPPHVRHDAHPDRAIGVGGRVARTPISRWGRFSGKDGPLTGPTLAKYHSTWHLPGRQQQKPETEAVIISPGPGPRPCVASGVAPRRDLGSQHPQLIAPLGRGRRQDPLPLASLGSVTVVPLPQGGTTTGGRPRMTAECRPFH